MLWVAVLTAGPVVGTVVIVGLIMAILQAATQVNDQAVAFGPKAISSILALGLGGSWIVQQMVEFTTQALVTMGTLVR